MHYNLKAIRQTPEGGHIEVVSDDDEEDEDDIVALTPIGESNKLASLEKMVRESKDCCIKNCFILKYKNQNSNPLFYKCLLKHDQNKYGNILTIWFHFLLKSLYIIGCNPDINILCFVPVCSILIGSLGLLILRLF